MTRATFTSSERGICWADLRDDNVAPHVDETLRFHMPISRRQGRAGHLSLASPGRCPSFGPGPRPGLGPSPSLGPGLVPSFSPSPSLGPGLFASISLLYPSPFLVKQDSNSLNLDSLYEICSRNHYPKEYADSFYRIHQQALKSSPREGGPLINVSLFLTFVSAREGALMAGYKQLMSSKRGGRINAEDIERVLVGRPDSPLTLPTLTRCHFQGEYEDAASRHKGLVPNPVFQELSQC